MNLAFVINEFLKSPHFVGLKPSTRYNLRHALTIAQDEMGTIAVEQVRPSTVQKFLDHHAAFPGKQRLLRSGLRTLEGWAMVRDLLPYPITTGTKSAKPGRGHQPWTLDQIKTAVQFARPDLARAIHLTSETGQRGSDIVKMRWSDLEVYKGREGINVKQQKTGKQLWVPFSWGFSQVIQTWEKRLPFIILSPEGRQYNRGWLSKEWSVEKATNPNLSLLKEERVTLHGLRAAKVITLRLEKYTDSEIANIVGMSVPMVSRYSRLADQKEAALRAMERNENPADENNVISLNKSLKTNDTTF